MYETQLKDWGSTGTEYPDGYSYTEGEAPVDEWDNYFTHNVIEDIDHLITETNENLLRREGGELISNLTVGSHRLVGDSGYVDFGGTELTVDATTEILQSLDVGGNITVTGTVDGVDVSGLRTDHDTLRTDHDGLDTSFSSHESDTTNPHQVTASQVGAPTQTEHDNLETEVSGKADFGHGAEAHGSDLLHNESTITPSYATIDDVPNIPEGAIVYVEEENQHYFEDGT